MKRLFFLVIFCIGWFCLALAPQTLAQPGGGPQAMPGPFLDLTEIARANEGNLRRYRGISVSLTLEQLETKEVARNALMDYVRKGGIVCLHTDAAALFGYVTMPASEILSTPIARAQNLSPFGAHPLISSQGACDFTGQIPGVHDIEFQLAPNDALVTSHPFATPLMQVKGGVTPDGRAVYALAIAPFGRGWAIFSPYNISNFAEGPLLIRNLERFARPPGSGYIPLSVRSIIIATDQGDIWPLQNELQDALPVSSPIPPQKKPLQTPDGLPSAEKIAEKTKGETATREKGEKTTALLEGADPLAEPDPGAGVQSPPQIRPDQSSVPLAPGEAEELLKDLQVRGPHTDAVLALLRVRAEYLRGEMGEAQQWLQTAQNEESALSSIGVWKAILAVNSVEANETRIDPITRANALDEAAQNWQAVIENSPISPIEEAPTEKTQTPETKPTPAAIREVFIGGIARDVLMEWRQGAALSVPFGPLTPILSAPIIGNASQMTLRCEPGDETSGLLKMAMQALADRGTFPRSTSVLLFSDAVSYKNYALQAGLQQGATKQMLNKWFALEYLGLTPPRRREDYALFQEEIQVRLKAPDMVTGRVFLQYLDSIHFRSLVRSGDIVQPASDFFGTSLFEALRFAFFQSR